MLMLGSHKTATNCRTLAHRQWRKVFALAHTATRVHPDVMPALHILQFRRPFRTVTSPPSRSHAGDGNGNVGSGVSVLDTAVCTQAQSTRQLVLVLSVHRQYALPFGELGLCGRFESRTLQTSVPSQVERLQLGAKEVKHVI
jgi:hypothetical protein